MTGSFSTALKTACVCTVSLVVLGCGGGGSAEAVSSEEVSLSDVTVERKAAEKAGAMAVRQYVTARLKTEKFITYNFDNPNKAELEAIIDDALAAWQMSENISAKAEQIADAAVADETVPLIATPKKTMGRNPAIDWAQELTDSYDAYPVGKKIRGLAAQLGTDAKSAYSQLMLAQAILKQDYDTDAEMYEQLMKGAMVTKTVCKTGLFISGVVVTGGSLGAVAGGSATLMEAGGIIISGTDTLVDIGSTASTIIMGENNSVTLAIDDIKQKIAPISAIGGLMSFNPAETGEQLAYLGDSILDFVTEGRVLGGLITVGGTGITVKIADISAEGRTPEQVIAELQRIGFEINQESAAVTVEEKLEEMESSADFTYEDMDRILDELLEETIVENDNGGGDNGGDIGGEEPGGDEGGGTVDEDDGDSDDDTGEEPDGDNDSDVPLTIGDIVGNYQVTFYVANPTDNPEAADRSAVIRIWQPDPTSSVINSSVAAGYFVFDSGSLTASGSSAGEYLSFSGSITGTISISGYLVYGIPYNVSGVKIP